ncbi:MAG: hypothetical protein ACREBR_04120, partial [bacterium]
MDSRRALDSKRTLDNRKVLFEKKRTIVVSNVPVAAGNIDNVRWTGGPRVTDKLVDPITPFCFRPDNF